MRMVPFAYLVLLTVLKLRWETIPTVLSVHLDPPPEGVILKSVTHAVSVLHVPLRN